MVYYPPNRGDGFVVFTLQPHSNHVSLKAGALNQGGMEGPEKVI